MSFIEKTTFSPLHCKVTFVMNQAIIIRWHKCVVLFLEILSCSADYLFILATNHTVLISFTITLPIWKWKASSFALFKVCLSNSWLYVVHINFRVKLSFSQTHTPVKIFIVIALRSTWGRHGTKSSNPWTWSNEYNNNFKLSKGFSQGQILWENNLCWLSDLFISFCFVSSGKECFLRLNWSQGRCTCKNIN